MTIPKIKNIEQKVQEIKIEKLSPSNFSSLVDGCKYQFVLSQVAKKQKEYLLPSNPAALLGTVIHKIIELRYSGKIKEEQDFEEQWNSLIQELEMQHYGKTDTELLIDWVKYYKTKKYVFSIPYIETDSNKPKTSEVGILDIDYLHGSIDRVNYLSDNQVELIDFKTGNIYETDNSDIKKIYSAQLKLYAILYQKKFSKEVVKLTLQELDGNSEKVPFTQSELEILYEEVKKIIEVLNQKEYPNLVKQDHNLCCGCSVRHLCSYYWQSETSEYDVCGKVKSISENSLMKIEKSDKTHTISNLLAVYEKEELCSIKDKNVRIVNLGKPKEVNDNLLYKSNLWSRIFMLTNKNQNNL
jgi:hypothetical protein